MTAEAKDTATLAGKYLTFTLGQESYGVQVLKVREIIRLMEITAVPQMPDYIKGVINLCGKIVPVVDLRLKFGLAKTEDTERTCIVVVQVAHAGGTRSNIGVIVDAVEEVVNLAASEIEDVPDFGSQLQTDYLLGMAKLKGVVKTLLDIDKMLVATAAEALPQTAVG